tara:strand:+ start:215 stop:463 length:249 start_codon:yes stop_codon:yes gene_type:complete
MVLDKITITREGKTDKELYELQELIILIAEAKGFTVGRMTNYPDINPNLPFNVDDTMRKKEPMVIDDVGQVYDPTQCVVCED